MQASLIKKTHLCKRCRIKELGRPDVLCLYPLYDPLHVLRDVSVLKQLGGLLAVVLARRLKEGLLEDVLV